MKGVSYYYAEFQRALDAVDIRMGEEFKAFSSTHSPKNVFLWLEEHRIRAQLPASMESLLTDFYWEIA